MATAFDLLTVEEAAEYLRLSPFTVRKLLREGQLMEQIDRPRGPEDEPIEDKRV